MTHNRSRPGPSRSVPADHPTRRTGNDPLARLYARPGFLLRRGWQVAAAVFEDECRGIELTPAQYGTLVVLHASPAIDQATLARALGYDKVTVLRILRGLEARGLVSRLLAPGQKRRFALKLTIQGEAALAGARSGAERAGRRLLSPLDAGEQAQLIALLQKLTGSLEDDARAPWRSPPQAESTAARTSTGAPARRLRARRS